MSGPDRPAVNRPEALWTALEEATVARENGDLVGTLTANVRVAAQGEEVDERAWALIFLGATLRKESRTDEALGVLREAFALTQDDQVRVGAMTCAMAIYCDLGNDEKARQSGWKL